MMRKLVYMLVMVAGIALGVEPKEVNSPEVEKLFLEPDGFKISITSSEEKWKVDSEGGSDKRIHYVVHLKNTTDSNFVGLRIEFCTYHAASDIGHEYIYPGHDYYYQDIPALKPHSTQDIKLRDQSSTKREDKFLSCTLKGVRVRIYLPLADGREAMREIRFPEDEMSKGDYVWVTYQYNQSSNPVSEERLLDPNVFSVSAQAINSEWKSDPGGTDITKDRMSKSTRYKVKMEYKCANNEYFIAGMRVDFRVYRKRKNGGETYISTDFKTKAVGVFRANQVAEIILDDLISYRSLYSGYQDEVLGARIRICIPHTDKGEFIKEIQIPANLSLEKYPWRDPVEERIVYSNSMDVASAFLDTSLFKISTMTLGPLGPTKWKNYKWGKVQSMQYFLQLKNNGKEDLHNVRMEYCLYTDKKDEEGRRIQMCSHTLPLGTIDAGARFNHDCGDWTSFKYKEGGSL